MTALAFAALGGCGDGQRGPAPHRAGDVGLAGCYMTVEVFPMERRPLRQLVPARFDLGTYTGGGHATLVFWVIACDSVRAGRARPTPGIISLIGAQIKSPRHPARPAAPGNFDHYLLFAHSNSRALVDLLRRRGFPAEYVRRMGFTRKRFASAGIPWRRGAYAEDVRARVFQPAHDHDNSYWRTAARGAVRLRVRFYHATDRACGECTGSDVVAEARSPIARILGGTELRGPFVAFDHNKIARGDMTVFPPQRLAAAGPAGAGPRGFLGVEGTAHSEATGVVVTKVFPHSPAARSGLRPRDVIVSVDRVAVRSFSALVSRISRTRPGTRVVVTISRERSRRDIPVVLAERPSGR